MSSVVAIIDNSLVYSVDFSKDFTDNLLRLERCAKECIVNLDSLLDEIKKQEEKRLLLKLEQSGRRPIGIGVGNIFIVDTHIETTDIETIDKSKKPKKSKYKPKVQHSARQFKINNNRPRPKYSREQDRRKK